ncbi:MAG: type II toxin-antitoxin system VapC family toxin [Microbacteriaceae bacterium]|nr:type II toxin-antitoxin system VapC family toxin [Microbacteriaceae bacterium]
MLVYADTSALVKLVLAEAETPALHDWLRTHEARLATSDLARAELMRAVRRSNPRSAPDVRELFERVAIISLDASVYEEAGLIAPMELRTLDAIHLSAARLLGEQLDGMLCYDDRLSEAAEYAGIRVFSPR